MLRGNNIVYLGGGSIFIFYFLLSTFPFIKHYPDLVDTSKVFTSGVKFSRFVSVVNGAVFVLVGIGMTLWLAWELLSGPTLPIDSSFLIMVLFSIYFIVCGWGLYYYTIKASKIILANNLIIPTS